MNEKNNSQKSELGSSNQREAVHIRNRITLLMQVNGDGRGELSYTESGKLTDLAIDDLQWLTEPVVILRKSDCGVDERDVVMSYATNSITVKGLNAAGQPAYQRYTLYYDIDGNWIPDFSTVVHDLEVPSEEAALHAPSATDLTSFEQDDTFLNNPEVQDLLSDDNDVSIKPYHLEDIGRILDLVAH